MTCSKCKKLIKPDWIAYKDSQTTLCYECIDEIEEPAHIDEDDGSWLASAGMGTDEDYEYGY
mgnify:CR=1 FL=1|tara:strand:+ start:301 stop:486 length:186 start_codon:yes stop_codon:yes gene_type:complete